MCMSWGGSVVSVMLVLLGAMTVVGADEEFRQEEVLAEFRNMLRKVEKDIREGRYEEFYDNHFEEANLREEYKGEEGKRRFVRDMEQRHKGLFLDVVSRVLTAEPESIEKYERSSIVVVKVRFRLELQGKKIPVWFDKKDGKWYFR